MENVILTILRNATGRNKNLAGRRISAFFICLLIACFSWFLIVLSKDYTQRFRFAINYLNFPQGKAAMNLLPDSVDMSVTASGFTMLSLKWFSGGHHIPVDCSVMKPKRDSLFYIALPAAFDKISKYIGSDVRIISSGPDTLFFNFARKARKIVPVKLVSGISFAKQFQLSDSIRVNPSAVEIFGDENEIDKIWFIETQPLTLSGLQKTTVRNIAFKLPGKLVGISADSATVTVPVDEFTEGQTEVEVTALNLPLNYSLKPIPDKVVVKYLVSISNSGKINAASFRAVVDYSEIKEGNNSKLKVKIISAPPFVSSAKVFPEKVEYIIRK